MVQILCSFAFVQLISVACNLTTLFWIYSGISGNSIWPKGKASPGETLFYNLKKLCKERIAVVKERVWEWHQLFGKLWFLLYASWQPLVCCWRFSPTLPTCMKLKLMDFWHISWFYWRLDWVLQATFTFNTVLPVSLVDLRDSVAVLTASRDCSVLVLQFISLN